MGRGSEKLKNRRQKTNVMDLDWQVWCVQCPAWGDVWRQGTQKTSELACNV